MDKIILRVPHKSLTPFNWENIPNLSIVTGINGAGKSQLLDLIIDILGKSATILDESISHTGSILRAAAVHRFGADKETPYTLSIYPTFYTNEIIHLTSDWKLTNGEPLNSKSLLKLKQKIYNTFLKQVGSDLWWKNPSLHEAFNHIKTTLRKPNSKITYEEFINALPKFFYNTQENLTQQISIIFYEYYLLRIEAQKKQIDEDDFIHKYGPPPWKELNKLIQELELDFACNYPNGKSITKKFELHLIHLPSGNKVDFEELSSGESVLISIAFYIFINHRYIDQKISTSIKLLLLDEPDAHLHPSMVNQFLKIIYQVFVKKYKAKVILTTHSPSTVALAPEEYDCKIFEMRSDPTQILEASKSSAIASLTSGLIVVTPVTKYILLEGIDDKPFYEGIYRHLVLNQLLNKHASFAFIAGTNIDSVHHWSNGLRMAGLSDVVRGVIDRDNGNAPSDGIYCLERYSIENYLLDPIVIFITGDNIPNALNKYPFVKGDEEIIKQYDNIKLQEIADIILKEVEPKVDQEYTLNDEDKKLIEVKFINGKTLNYPKWLLTKRGKTLMPMFRETFARRNTIYNNSLIMGLKRLTMIPEDLLNLFKQIQL